MIDFYFINSIALFLINISGLWFASWIYLANRKIRTNQLFFLITIFILSWVDLVYFASISTYRPLAILLSRLAFIPVYLFLLTTYFFVFFFPRKEKRPFLLDIMIVICVVSLFLITLFTNLHVKDVIFREWGLSPVLGEGQIFVYSVISLITILFSGILFRKYFKLSREEKLRVQYFLIGFFIFVVTNIVFNVILAQKYVDFPYYLIGNYSAIFLIGFTAYAIVKRELFGMKIVLTALVVCLTTILLALDIFVFTEDVLLRLLKSFVLVIFLYFGYLLIKSVLLEIKRREQLEDLTTKLEITNVKLDTAYKQLQVLDRAKSEFISIASHQLRTPLTAIKGYISMILEGTYGKLVGKVNRPMENVYKSNERLIKLINDLLSVSRIEAGKLEFTPEKASLEEIILSVVDELKITTEKRGLYLKFDKSAEPIPQTIIDKDKMRQVILNIIDNSIKYTERGGITIKLKIENPAPLSGAVRGLKLKIVISDTGEGMDKGELSKIFETFSRGMAGTRLYSEGAGLGLYIAKKFAEMNGGRIWAESEGKGKGSTFYIELPVK